MNAFWMNDYSNDLYFCLCLQKSQFKIFPNGTLRINSVEVYDGVVYNCLCRTAGGILNGQAKVNVLGECVCVCLCLPSLLPPTSTVFLYTLVYLVYLLRWWYSEVTDMSDKSITHHIIFYLHHLALDRGLTLLLYHTCWVVQISIWGALRCL